MRLLRKGYIHNLNTMRFDRKAFGVDFVVFLAFILANLRATFFFPLYPSLAFFPLGAAWYEIGLWFVLIIFVLTRLRSEGKLLVFYELFRKNLYLVFFILFALISVLWSGAPLLTIFRGLEVTFATLFAAYIVTKFDLMKFLNILAIFGCYIVVLSLVMAIMLPELSATPGHPYYGAWKGIFWHRNHFGILMALYSMVFFFQTLNSLTISKWDSIFWCFFYFFAGAFAFLSRSATGIILLLLLNLFSFAILGWLQIRRKLSSVHYIIIGLIISVISIFCLLNLDDLFSLLGRNSTLTGRTDLWKYLLNNVVNQSPVFGHGFGYLWSDKAFRLETSKNIGWPFQVFIGDNGYIDILLHLGLFGLILAVGLLAVTVLRSIKFALNDISPVNFFPLLLTSFAIIANITFSMFMETEVFVWMQLVSVLFFATDTKRI